MPSKEKMEQQIQVLRTAIQEAVKEERYEDAANLRDDIRALESKIKKGEERA